MLIKQEIVKDYIRCFCKGDVQGIEPLLASDLRFSGTFYDYHLAKGYLDDLKKDPPEKCGCQVLSITGNEDSVAVFYDYEKPDRVVQIAQLFKIRNQKIYGIVLIFDSR